MLTNPLHPEGDDDHDVRSHANSAEFVSNDFEGWSSTYFDVFESAVNLVEQIGQSQNYFDNGGGASIGTVEAKHGIEDYGQGSDFDEVDLLHNVKQDLARTGMNVKKSRQLECNSEAGDFTFCSGISENVEPPQSSFTEDRDKDPTHHPSKIPRNQGVESDLPSVERRRRRRNNHKNLYSSPTRYSSVHRDLDSVGTDFSRGKKWTELGNWGLVILLVFLIVFTVQQDKIIHDIKQYHRRRSMMYSQSNNSLIEKIRRIPEISSIFVTYTLLFPTCELLKTVILLLHQLYLIITNPFEAPRLISHIFWAAFENAGLVLNQMQRGMRTLSSPFIRVLGFDLLVGTDDPFGHGDDFEYFDDDNHGGMASTAINGGYQQGSFRPLSNNLPLSVGVGGIPELERVDSFKNVSHGNTNGNSFDFAGSERLKEIDVKSNGDSVRDDKCGFKSISGTSAGNAKPFKGPNKVESNAIHSRVARYDAEGLNPAFLTEEEYPPGWLMYHPNHGVITREKLIEFERH